jgi:nitrogen-specific signal transduction histidine kinase
VSLLTHTFARRKERLRDRRVPVHAIPILAIPGPIAKKERGCATRRTNTQATLARPCTHAKEGSEVVLIVGPGIKPGELERIFEKFHRGGRADRRKAGTGLGLSISRRLVEAMGGTIVATPIAPRPSA